MVVVNESAAARLAVARLIMPKHLAVTILDHQIEITSRQVRELTQIERITRLPNGACRKRAYLHGVAVYNATGRWTVANVLSTKTITLIIDIAKQNPRTWMVVVR
jgi:hypothetical protein